MRKAELILGFSSLRRTFDKQNISEQNKRIPNKLVAPYKRNSSQQITENTTKSTEKRAEETDGDY